VLPVYESCRFFTVHFLSLAFPLQNATCYSGRCWVRTSVLCRVKADPCLRDGSLLFRNTCKAADLLLKAFVGVRRSLSGLMYYWCIWVPAKA
jgi:hypothetical protein